MDVLDPKTYGVLLTRFLTWLEVHGLRILIILIATFILRHLSILLIKKIFNAAKHRHKDDFEAIKRLNTLEHFIRMTATALIGIVVLILILRECGIEIGPILAAAGVFGLAVSFGAQHLVQDVIAGFFILYDNQIREGDMIKAGDKTGTVERMNLRLVVLRDADGSLHYIRSGQLGVITNLTQDFSYYVFELGVSYDSDLDKVFRIVNEISENMQEDPAMKYNMLAPIEIFGLDRFDDSAVVIKGRIKSVPQQQWTVGRHFNLKIKKAFDAQGIDIPFPQRTIHVEPPKAPVLKDSTDKENAPE